MMIEMMMIIIFIMTIPIIFLLQGIDIAAKLKKVSDDEKTHKNPALRGDGLVIVITIIIIVTVTISIIIFMIVTITTITITINTTITNITITR